MRYSFRVIIAGLTALVPLAAQAVIFDNPLGDQPRNLLAVICRVRTGIFPLFLAMGVLAFLIAAALYLFAGDDSSKIMTAKKALMAAAVGVFLAILSFGLPRIIAQAFGVPESELPQACQ